MERRIKTLRITPELLRDWLDDGPPGRRAVENRLPLDARIVGAEMTADSRYVRLALTSESYPSLAEGEDAPEIEPIWFEAVV